MGNTVHAFCEHKYLIIFYFKASKYFHPTERINIILFNSRCKSSCDHCSCNIYRSIFEPSKNKKSIDRSDWYRKKKDNNNTILYVYPEKKKKQLKMVRFRCYTKTNTSDTFYSQTGIKKNPFALGVDCN